MNEVKKLLKKWGFSFEERKEERYTKYTLSRGDYFSPEQLYDLSQCDELDYLETNIQGEMMLTIYNARVKK